MAGIGTKILAAEFNDIQKKVAAVLGTGGTNPVTNVADASFGYGQSVLSIQVSANAKITANQWNTLRGDLIKARQHQLNVTVGTKESTDPGYTPGQDLKLPTTSNKITETDRASFNQMADYIISDRLAVGTSQIGREPVVSANYTSNWNATITHTVTLNFATTETPRYFFNAGGYFDITASQAITGTNTKNTSWQTLIGQIGTTRFSRTTTTTTGSGTASSVGFINLTTSNTLIYQKLGATYAPNAYRIYARIGSTSAQLIFTIQFADASTPTNPTWGIDEQVTGQVTSTVELVRATGTNVSVPAPTNTSSFV